MIDPEDGLPSAPPSWVYRISREEVQPWLDMLYQRIEEDVLRLFAEGKPLETPLHRERE